TIVLVNGQAADPSTYTIDAAETIQWSTPPAAGARITTIEPIVVELTRYNVTAVKPTKGSTIKITPAMSSNQLDVYFDRFKVGNWGDFIPVSVPTSWHYDDYSKELVLDNLVKHGQIVLKYTKDQLVIPQPTAIINMAPYYVDFMVDSLADVDGTNGYFVNPLYSPTNTGSQLLNKSDKTIYKWDGSNWVSTGITVGTGDEVLSLADGRIYDGGTLAEIYKVGDNYASPPLIQYPKYGSGVASGTYVLGQDPSAATIFPEAYNIINQGGSHGYY
ncbi:MAG: hypothetical protein D6698_11970, partial [Gammaproteobacteria bacterium]